MAPATAQVTTPVDPFTGRKPVPTPAPQARPLGALRRDTPVRRVSPPPPAGDRTRPVEARAPATPPILEPRTFARADAKEEGDVVSAQALDLSVREQGPTALEAPPYRVRLLTDARMSVETSGFACLVPVSQEDARSLAAIAFEARVRREKRVEAAQTLQAAPSEAVTAPAAAPRVALAAPRVCADLSAEDCRFILSLVRERYRLAIEERCGPPPR
jgi:hypothetical protein